jgi:hypothetical protein
LNIVLKKNGTDLNEVIVTGSAIANFKVKSKNG